jgi:hypothetical protein
MALTVETVKGTRRFEALAQGQISHEAASHDRPLLARADWLVVPTLGAIVPNWLLLIPRDLVLNFRALVELRGRSPEHMVADVVQHLGLRKDEIIWFEHGPCVAGSLTGCGLDHAHIHILIRPRFSFEAFAEKTRALCKLEWIGGASEGAYNRLSIDRSYLIAGSGDATIIAQDVEASGSQFFRRVVGALADVGEAWDYRQFPHADHIAETIGTFRSLESHARRDE